MMKIDICVVSRILSCPQEFNPNSWEFLTLVADAREELEHAVLIRTAASLK